MHTEWHGDCWSQLYVLRVFNVGIQALQMFIWSVCEKKKIAEYFSFVYER